VHCTAKKLIFLVFLFLAFAGNASAEIVWNDETDSASTSTNNFGVSVGSPNYNEFAGYSFNASSTFNEIKEIRFCGQKFGNPTDDVIIDLYNASLGVSTCGASALCPTTLIQSNIATITNPASVWTGGCTGTGHANTETYNNWTFSEQGIGDYALVFRRSGTVSAVDYWFLSHQASLGTGNAFVGDSSPEWLDSAKQWGYLEIDISTTPSEIISPYDTEIITSIPFQASGTCDENDSPFLNYLTLEIQHLDLGFYETTTVICAGDVWTSPPIGSTLFDSNQWSLVLSDSFYDVLDIAYFEVNYPDNPNPTPPSTATTCSGISSAFLEGLCDILAWVFIPSNSILSGFGDLWEDISAKPPFGYFTASLGALNSLEQGTSSDELSGTSALSNYFDPIKTFLASVLWLLFAFYAIKRVGSIHI